MRRSGAMERDFDQTAAQALAAQQLDAQEAATLFRALDVTGSGTVSLTEARRSLPELGWTVAQDGYIDGLWRVYDVTGSGVLDPKEFARLLKVLRSRAHRENSLMLSSSVVSNPLAAATTAATATADRVMATPQPTPLLAGATMSPRPVLPSRPTAAFYAEPPRPTPPARPPSAQPAHHAAMFAASPPPGQPYQATQQYQPVPAQSYSSPEVTQQQYLPPPTQQWGTPQQPPPPRQQRPPLMVHTPVPTLSAKRRTAKEALRQSLELEAGGPPPFSSMDSRQEEVDAARHRSRSNLVDARQQVERYEQLNAASNEQRERYESGGNGARDLQAETGQGALPRTVSEAIKQQQQVAHLRIGSLVPCTPLLATHSSSPALSLASRPEEPSPPPSLVGSVATDILTGRSLEDSVCDLRDAAGSWSVFCINNDEACIINDQLCIENDEFWKAGGPRDSDGRGLAAGREGDR